MSTESIVLIVLGIIAVAYVGQMLLGKQSKADIRPDRLTSADSVGPTETGRYRVKEIIGDLPSRNSGLQESDDNGEKDSLTLPDPFDDQ